MSAAHPIPERPERVTARRRSGPLAPSRILTDDQIIAVAQLIEADGSDLRVPMEFVQRGMVPAWAKANAVRLFARLDIEAAGAHPLEADEEVR